MPEKIVYVIESTADREIALTRVFDAPRRLVWEAWTDPKPIEMTATFADEDGKARLKMRMVFVSAEVRDRDVQEYGSVEGGKQTLERLAEHLSDRLAAKTEGGVR